MSRRPSTAAALVALIATIAAACTGGGARAVDRSRPVPVKVAFLHDTSVPGSAQSSRRRSSVCSSRSRRRSMRGDLPVVPEVVGLDVDGDDGERARARPRDRGRSGRTWRRWSGRSGRSPPTWATPCTRPGSRRSACPSSIRRWPRAAGRPGGASSPACQAKPPRSPRRSEPSPRSIDGVCVVGDGSDQSSTMGELLGANLGAARDRRHWNFPTMMRCRVSSNASLGRGAGWSRGRGSARVRRRCAPG